MYKGGPNISPEIIDPPSALYTLYILSLHVFAFNACKVVQILPKRYISPCMQGVQIFHLKCLIPT